MIGYEKEALSALKQCLNQRSLNRQEISPALASKLVHEGFLVVHNREVFTEDMRSMIPVTEFKLSAKGERLVKSMLL